MAWLQSTEEQSVMFICGGKKLVSALHFPPVKYLLSILHHFLFHIYQIWYTDSSLSFGQFQKHTLLSFTLLGFWKRFLRKSKRHPTMNIRELKLNGSWCTYVAGTAFRHTVRDTGRCNLRQDLDISLHCYRAGWHNHSHLEKTRIHFIFLYSSNYLQEYKRGWLLDV